MRTAFLIRGRRISIWLTVLFAGLAVEANGQFHWAVYVMNADSGDVKKITQQDKLYFGSPTWAHHGKTIAYDGGEGPGFTASHIFVHKLGEEKGRDIGPGNSPSFSPDDQQIAFFYPSWTRSGHRPGVWVMNADGENREWISEGARPRWSPEGDKLVFASSHEGFPSLYVYDTISLERTRILERSSYDEIPGAVFSPDAGQLVFIGYKGGGVANNYSDGELAVVEAKAGSKPSVVCRGRLGWHPDWSPAGKKLLFRISDGTMERLHILDLEADGKPVALPNQFGRRNNDAVWSPDGTQIVFNSDRG